MNKQELITYLNNVDNILKYSIKGGTSMFNKEYPNLLNEINENTKEIQIYSNNKKLVAKLLYLKKYQGKIENIKYMNKIMIFDYKINDFKISNLNAAQKQWDVCRDELSKITEIYNKNETIELLKNDYKNYLGKSGNRKLLKLNKKLYLSLYYHTKQLNKLNKNLNKFSMRIYILINNIDINCHIHNTLKFWKLERGVFKIICNKCEPNYPSKDWFIKTYGDKWKKYLNIRKGKLKKIKTNGRDWHINKYGNELGIIKYRISVEKKINNIVKLKGNRYSKISQELFWNIYSKLNNKNKIYFYELNQEFVIKIPIKYKYDKTVMIVDFKKNNKIIEYNGVYWHNINKDNIRYNILKDMGFDVFIVSSDEYNRNNKNNVIINNCLNFLSC